MKLSKLLQMLLFGLAHLHLGVGPDDGGGAGDEGDAGGDGGDEDGNGGDAGDAGDDKKQGGKKPTDQEAKLLKEVMQKKEALRQRDADLAAAQARLKEFDGIDPVKVRELLDAQKQAETAQLEAKGEWDRLRARMAEEHANEKKALQTQIAELQAQVGNADGVINELSIGQQFAQSGFIASELTMPASKARALYAAHFELEDGRVVGYDKPKGAANRTALVDAAGEPLGFDGAMRKIIEADPDKDHLLKSKVKSGAGSESRKADGKQAAAAPIDSVSRIGNGLKGLLG